MASSTDRSFCLVKRTRRFVKDQEGGLPQQGAGEREPLPFAPGHTRAAVTDNGLQALRQSLDKFGGARRNERLLDRGIIGLRIRD